jgi:hypothetical protein
MTRYTITAVCDVCKHRQATTVSWVSNTLFCGSGCQEAYAKLVAVAAAVVAPCPRGPPSPSLDSSLQSDAGVHALPAHPSAQWEGEACGGPARPSDDLYDEASWSGSSDGAGGGDGEGENSYDSELSALVWLPPVKDSTAERCRTPQRRRAASSPAEVPTSKEGPWCPCLQASARFVYDSHGGDFCSDACLQRANKIRATFAANHGIARARACDLPAAVSAGSRGFQATSNAWRLQTAAPASLLRGLTSAVVAEA